MPLWRHPPCFKQQNTFLRCWLYHDYPRRFKIMNATLADADACEVPCNRIIRHSSLFNFRSKARLTHTQNQHYLSEISNTSFLSLHPLGIRGTKSEVVLAVRNEVECVPLHPPALSNGIIFVLDCIRIVHRRLYAIGGFFSPALLARWTFFCPR